MVKQGRFTSATWDYQAYIVLIRNSRLIASTWGVYGSASRGSQTQSGQNRRIDTSAARPSVNERQYLNGIRNRLISLRKSVPSGLAYSHECVDDKEAVRGYLAGEVGHGSSRDMKWICSID
jgi:hypothetical protein